MKECKVTIAVPVYNGQNVIERCVNSIFEQSYQNIEIIVVNDGSVDDTKRILDGLRKKDARLYVIDINNGGVSNARNQAIKQASGDLICFVDADDYILPSYVQGFVDNFEDNALLVTTYQTVTDISAVRQNVCKVSREIYSPEDAEMEMFYGYKLGNYCWDKCYDLRFIRDNKIMFDTSLKIGEDTAFVNEYVRKSKKVICLDQKNYVHIVNDQSVMENLYRDNAWKSLYESICVSKSILETSKSSKANKAILAAVVQAEEHLLRIMCVKNVTGEIYDGELKSFKKNYLSVVLDPRIDVRQRIKVLMMGINPFRRKFYERIYRVK